MGNPSRRGASYPKLRNDNFRQKVKGLIGDVRVTTVWPRNEPVIIVDRALPEVEPMLFDPPALPSSTPDQHLLTRQDCFVIAVVPRIDSIPVGFVAVGLAGCSVDVADS